MNEELHAEYIASLQKRIDRIESLKAKLTEGNPKAEENIRLIAHSLHGSGVTFGYPEISEAGKQVEHAESGNLGSSLETLKSVLKKVVADNGGALQQDTSTPQQKGAPTGSPAAGKKASSQVSEDNRPLKILVVEDDDDMASLITSMLQSLPKKLQIKIAGTAAKAQEAIVKDRFDLIIMDLVLPDRDGRELIQEIKLEFRLSTPLLVLSGIENDAVRVECMGLGADKYVTKPFYDDDLMGEVKKLLGKKIKTKLTLVPLDGEAPEEEPEEEDMGPGPLKGKTILLAEDDKMQAKLVCERLNAQSAIVKHATNGREAMQLLRTQEFSLLILDVKMPVMDGFEVLQRARGELAMDAPIIMVTAMGSEEDIIRGYDLGATDYILKPFSDVQLVARVKSLLK